MPERVFKRSEARARLNVTKYRYIQLVELGILAEPIRLSKNSHPLHTESQLRSAEKKLHELATPAPARSTKRLSAGLFQEIAKAARS